jgi:hypothetical protein
LSFFGKVGEEMIISCETCKHKSDLCSNCGIGDINNYEPANKTMKVKIIKCSELSYWYRNNIGELYEVEELNEEYYYRVIREEEKESSNWGRGIVKDDCIILDKPEKVIEVKPMPVNKPERIADFSIDGGYSKLSDLPGNKVRVSLIKGKEEFMGEDKKKYVVVCRVVAIDKKNQKVLIDNILYFTENVTELEKTIITDLIRKREKLSLNDIIIKSDIVITYEKEA